MAAEWHLLTEYLNASQGAVDLTWSEFDAIVGGVPESAIKHYPQWWHGERPNTRAWRAAGYEAVDVRPGVSVRFVRSGHAADATAMAPTHRRERHASIRQAASARFDGRDDRNPSRPMDSRPSAAGAGADLLLVSCVKEKRAEPAAAKDLYTSALFRKARTYAEASGRRWFVLSAEYGLVMPTEWLSPYDRMLGETPPKYREAWGSWVVARLELLTGPLTNKIIEAHAGDLYLAPVRQRLAAAGATLLEPLRGLRFGERLAWYAQRSDRPSARPRGHIADAERFVQLLTHTAQALTPDAFLRTGGEGLRRPGLYSWWVDPTGAADLTTGLGVPIRAGLVYVGLAGATRWPSGQSSQNTLWGRIKGMHLGGNHEFSTFRRTLGSILAEARGQDTIDEAALTGWMYQHLRVIAVPFDDRDTLGHLEDAVLSALDPPLNLNKVSSSEIRERLKVLRQPTLDAEGGIPHSVQSTDP